jgi:hypothetical protein
MKDILIVIRDAIGLALIMAAFAGFWIVLAAMYGGTQ